MLTIINACCVLMFCLRYLCAILADKLVRLTATFIVFPVVTFRVKTGACHSILLRRTGDILLSEINHLTLIQSRLNRLPCCRYRKPVKLSVVLVLTAVPAYILRRAESSAVPAYLPAVTIHNRVGDTSSCLIGRDVACHRRLALMRLPNLAPADLLQ
jgi:hypothetical protein